MSESPMPESPLPEATGATTPWQPVRLSLLAILCASAVLVLGRAIVTPSAKGPSTNPSSNTALQQAVPLPNWQLVKSAPIQPEPAKAEPNTVTNSEPDFLVAQQYLYRQNNNQLDVELRYMLGDGNNSRFLFVYTPVRAANAKLESRYHPSIGHYGVLTHEGRAYLSACINPRGESTTTEQQFKHNSYQNDLQPSRLLPWLLGQEPLLDQRCLWTLMSMPLSVDAKTQQTNAEATFKQLETAWVSWHAWWRSHYPRS